MPDNLSKAEIDRGKCSGCGICVRVCPSGMLAVEGGKSVVVGSFCISCEHCASACPQGAIRIPVIEPGMSEYETFTADKKWLPHGKFDVPLLVRLMSSRRSCRSFSDRPVERAVLEDLVKIGTTAPSGTNSQCWSFMIIPTRGAVVAFGHYIADFFRHLNATAEKSYLRIFLRLIGKKDLDIYYRNYYQWVKAALEEWESSGRDRLFHGAPAVIIVGSQPGASSPAEDALLATQNILLAAHAMGLGSCLIGLAVGAMKEDCTIRRKIGMPKEEAAHAVIALGYPAEVYRSVAGRKKAPVRYFEEPISEKH